MTTGNPSSRERKGKHVEIGCLSPPLFPHKGAGITSNQPEHNPVRSAFKHHSLVGVSEDFRELIGAKDKGSPGNVSFSVVVGARLSILISKFL